MRCREDKTERRGNEKKGVLLDGGSPRSASIRQVAPSCFHELTEWLTNASSLLHMKVKERSRNQIVVRAR